MQETAEGGYTMRVVIMKEGGKVDKFATAKERAKELAQKAWDGTKHCLSSAWTFCKDNREDLVVLVPLGIGAITGLKKATQKRAVDTERERINYSYYDPRHKRYWDLKRPMNNWERLELEERQQAGELTGHILQSMGLLK